MMTHCISPIIFIMRGLICSPSAVCPFPADRDEEEEEEEEEDDDDDDDDEPSVAA